MNAAEIARNFLARQSSIGMGEYLPHTQCAELCRAVLDAEAYRARVEGHARADGCAHAAASQSLGWIIKHCAEPEKAAWSKYRGMEAIRHKAEHALKCMHAGSARLTEKGDG